MCNCKLIRCYIYICIWMRMPKWSNVYSIITSIVQIPQFHTNLVMFFKIVSSSWPPSSESPAIDWRLSSTPAQPPHPLQPCSEKYTRTAAWDHPPSPPLIWSCSCRIETLWGLIGWWRPWQSFSILPAARSVEVFVGMSGEGKEALVRAGLRFERERRRKKYDFLNRFYSGWISGRFVAT